MSITLIYPWVLILIFIYPILISLLSKIAPKRVFGNFKLLKKVKKNSISIDRVLFILILFCLLVALAYPVKKGVQKISITKGRDILILLDASNSMRDDNRFEVAKKILLDFIDKRDGDRVGLVVFGDRAYVASPLSSDLKSIKTILKHLRAGVAGGRDTALYEAIYMGANLFDNKESKKSIILLTDGVDTIKDMPIDVAVAKLKQKNITLYAIGVGNDYKKDILKKLANNGATFSADSSDKLANIYNQIDALHKRVVVKKSISNIKPLYKYPLVVAIILMIILLVKYKNINLILAILFAILALIVPVGYTQQNSIHSKKALAIVLDISWNMRAKDIYPNRWIYAKSRLNELIDTISDIDIALVAFDNRVYLISPATKDKEAIESKLNHLNPAMDRDGKALIDAISWSNKLLDRYKDKNILVITASKIDKLDISKIKDIKSRVYIYAVATLTGATIKDKEGRFIEDNQGVVVSYLDTKLKQITSITKGLFRSINDGVNGFRDIESRLSNYKSFDIQLLNDNKIASFIFIILATIFTIFARVNFRFGIKR